MMNLKNARTRYALAAAVVLLLTLAPQAVLAGKGGGSLAVVGCDVVSNAVTVTVANNAMSTGSGTLVVEVLLGKERARTTASVSLKAGQAATVSFQFQGPVSDVVLVGITEDQSPFG